MEMLYTLNRIHDFMLINVWINALDNKRKKNTCTAEGSLRYVRYQ